LVLNLKYIFQYCEFDNNYICNFNRSETQSISRAYNSVKDYTAPPVANNEVEFDDHFHPEVLSFYDEQIDIIEEQKPK
jgi:hypothetical protein